MLEFKLETNLLDVMLRWVWILFKFLRGYLFPLSIIDRIRIENMTKTLWWVHLTKNSPKFTEVFFWKKCYKDTWLSAIFTFMKYLEIHQFQKRKKRILAIKELKNLLFLYNVFVFVRRRKNEILIINTYLHMHLHI